MNVMKAMMINYSSVHTDSAILMKALDSWQNSAKFLVDCTAPKTKYTPNTPIVQCSNDTSNSHNTYCNGIIYCIDWLVLKVCLLSTIILQVVKCETLCRLQNIRIAVLLTLEVWQIPKELADKLINCRHHMMICGLFMAWMIGNWILDKGWTKLTHCWMSPL